MRTYDLPSNADHLFITDKSGVNWIPTVIKDMFIISEGYRQAATIIYENLSRKDNFINKQFLACVMVFCFRHFIEVRIKEITYFGKKEIFEQPEFKKSHDLVYLFHSYLKEFLYKYNPKCDQKQINNVKRLIKELNHIDPNSENFRYPVNQSMEPSLSMPNFDVDNFKLVMDKLSNFFDLQLEEIQIQQTYNETIERENTNSITPDTL